MQGIYAEYERETYEKLSKTIKAHPNKAVQALWGRFVETRWTVERAGHAAGNS